jgi:hypothetical protein
MNYRLGKYLTVIFYALFLTLSVQVGQQSMAADFTIYFDEEDAYKTSSIRNRNNIFISYKNTMLDELARMGFRVKLLGQNKQFSDQDLILKAGFISLDEKFIIPIAKIKSAKTNLMLASLKTASFSLTQKDYELEQQLDASAISIVRALYARLLSKNWAELSFENNPWETQEYKLRLQLSGMSGCFKNYFLDTLETEFPGSVSIAVLSETDVGTSKYNFVTTAKNRFVAKWIRALLSEQLLVENNDFELSSRNKLLALRLFPNSIPEGSFCR